MWVTLANITGQDSMCWSLATPGDPFGTCLIGVPEWEPTSFQGMVANQTILNSSIMMQECN